MQLVNGSVDGFQTAEIGGLANRVVDATNKIKNGLISHVQEMSNPDIITKGLQTFENMVINLMATKPECVTDPMRSVTTDAVSHFQNCLMDAATVQDKTQQGEKKLQNLLDSLKTVDSELPQVTDPVLRAEKIALAELDLVGGFFLEMTQNIITSTAPIMTCKQSEATNLRDTVLSYIADASKCYS